ncbi:MAG: mechanosensitive ion channel family protein [Firmicutes bacterium]|nr:mechanosensitive ion channel family protein [Bacillota bacterium]
MPEILNAFQNFLSVLLGKEIYVAVIILALFLAARKIFIKYIFSAFIKLSRKTKTDFDTNLLEALEHPLGVFVVILGAYFSLRYLPLTAYQDMLVLKTFRAIVIVFVAWCLYNIAGSFLFTKLARKLEIEVDEILIPFLIKVVRVIIIVLAISIIADEWGYNVSGFVAGLGLGGLAIALAAKDALGNIFGGIVIITDKPFSIGDWIFTPSVEGTVEDISFRSTKVRTFAQALVTVPNSTLANEPITNWTRMGKRRVSFHLGVANTTPGEKLRKCVHKIKVMLESHPGIHKDTIFARFEKFEENSLEIMLYFFTVTTIWGEFLEVKEDVNFKIMEILENEGVALALPRISVRMETPHPGSLE